VRLTPTPVDVIVRLVWLIVRSRASALLSVVPRAPLPYLSILSVSPLDSERVPKLDRRSTSEVGERGAKADGEWCPSTLAGC